MTRVKVLQVLEATTGGTARHLLYLAHHLDASRHELHVAYSPRRDPAAAGRFVAALRGRAVVHPVPMLRRPAPLADLRALRALARLIREHGYHVVHTHAAKAGFLGRLAAHRAGTTAIVHTPHTFPFQRVDTRLTGLYRWLDRRAARWCHRIVCLTTSQRELALAAGLCGPEKLVVIPNGVELPAEAPQALRRRYRAELGIPDGVAAVGVVGRLTPQKDIQTVLDTAALLLRTAPDTRIVLVGATDNPRYLASLRPRPSDAAWQTITTTNAPPHRTVWSPELPIDVLGPRPDAAGLVAAFDVLLLPSLYEGQPYALLEAMACGVPAVASNVTGNCDVIEHGATGILVPPGAPAECAASVHELLGDAVRRHKMGSAARQAVEARFQVGPAVSQLAELYLSALR